MCDATSEVLQEARVRRSILRIEPRPERVEEHGLELLAIPARDASAVVDDQPGQALLAAPPHDARLLRAEVETLVANGMTDDLDERTERGCEIRAPREGQVVRIAR